MRHEHVLFNDGEVDELSTWVMHHPDFFDPPTAGFAASMAALSTWVTRPSLTYSQAAIQQFLALADSQMVAHAHSEGFTLVSDEGEASSKRRPGDGPRCLQRSQRAMHLDV